MALESKKRLF